MTGGADRGMNDLGNKSLAKPETPSGITGSDLLGRELSAELSLVLPFGKRAANFREGRVIRY